MNQEESRSKVHLHALGCRTNQYEIEAYRTQLGGMGYESAQPGERADLCVINTCSVTAQAARESRRLIRKFARENPGAEIVVTGCLVDTEPGLQEQVPEITRLIPNKQKEELIRLLYPGLEEYPEFQIEQFQAHTRAFVKVQDGCNSYCTYCIIPYVRGRSRSRAKADILAEVGRLVGRGYREIVFTGINIGDYDGGEESSSLAELVAEADQIEGVERIRISSIDPDDVDEPLIEAVLEGKHTCHSFHLVLQSGSNVVLKRMNRKYTRQQFLRMAEQLRVADPDFTLTTDVIIGFPGESEKDLLETEEVIAEAGFLKVHLFPYSDRPRTRAMQYPDKIPPAEIAERKQRILRSAERAAFQRRAEFVGRRMELLTEGGGRGHTENFLPCLLEEGESLPSNQIVPVELVENLPDGLRALPCGEVR